MNPYGFPVYVGDCLPEREIFLVTSSAGTTIFSPKRVGGIELSNRIVMAPMAVHVAPTTGESTDDTRRYFLERTKGGAALIMGLLSGYFLFRSPGVGFVSRTPFPVFSTIRMESGRALGGRDLRRHDGVARTA